MQNHLLDYNDDVYNQINGYYREKYDGYGMTMNVRVFYVYLK